MNKKINIAVLTLASALFTGVLVNSSPLSVSANDDFIVDLHYETFLKVETGHNFTVVLSTNNEVFTFGRNDRGQLGNGTTETSLSVFNITDSFNLNPGETIVDIDAGWGFTVAATSTNRIFAWGDPQVVQLAKGTVSEVPQTTPFDLTSGFNPNNEVVRKISAGDSNIMVWTDFNNVRMAGGNNFGQLAQGNTTDTTGVVSVNFGALLNLEALKDVGIFSQTAYALTENGKVLTWGKNSERQTGFNSAQGFIYTPQNITSSFGLIVPEKVVSVSIGVNHGIAVTSAYKIFFWGTNSNSAAGDTTTLPKGTVKNVPFNATAAFIYEDESNYNDGFATNYNRDFSDPTIIYSEEVYRPLKVYAGNDATFFDVEYAYREYIENVPQAYDLSYYFWVIGLNAYEGQKYIISGRSATELTETRYADFNYYNEGYDVIDFGLSRTHSIFLNSENDFTIFGSNLYGEHGVGYTTLDGAEYNSNYSYNVRDFINYLYSELPTNLTVPLDAYFNPAGGQTGNLGDEQRAIFGYWYGFNDNVRGEGIVDYLFPEAYPFGDGLNEKEWSVVTAEQKTFMHQIIATVYEDEILYESYIRTDELIYEELESGREAASWLRYDMNYYANYGSYELGWDEELYLYEDIIALLPVSVETRLNRYRELLAAVEGFENTYLQPFLALMEDESNDVNVDLDFVYFDDYYNENVLDLEYNQMEYLLDNEYESMILSIFDAYEELPELVQLLINEWNYYGIYEELYDAYYEFYADEYSESLNEFLSNFQEGEWSWYWPLFENLTELETLLAGIEDLNEISYDIFVDVYGNENEYFSYEMYEYWLWLNRLQPHLEEGKDVFEQIVVIEELIQEEDGYYWVDIEDAAGIIAMYNDFLALSEDAQELLDPEYVNFIYSLALEVLAQDVEDQLWNIWNIEDESGTYGLFANYDDVLASLEAYEALPEDALEYLDEEAIAYYEYLLSIKLALEEGLDVYDQIMDIEALDLENLDDTTIEAISNMYQDYLELSEEAQELLDPEYVAWLVSLATSTVEGNVEELPATVEDFDALFNDEETKDATIASLLNAWRNYQAMSDEVKDMMDPEARAQLEALYARYLELTRPTVDLLMIGLILVHLSAGVYFAFKKREVLVKNS